MGERKDDEKIINSQKKRQLKQPKVPPLVVSCASSAAFCLLFAAILRRLFTAGLQLSVGAHRQSLAQEEHTFRCSKSALQLDDQLDLLNNNNNNNKSLQVKSPSREVKDRLMVGL